MNIDQLYEQILKLNDEDFVQLADRFDKDRAKRAKSILSKASAAAARLTGDKALATPRTIKVAEARYANPDNPEQTWSGKGRKPMWFIEQLERGKNADEMIIS